MRILLCSAILLSAASYVPAGQPPPLLPESTKSAVADQKLSASEEKRSDALAHYIEAQRLEDAGRMREALGHYLKVLDAGVDAHLTGHVAEMAASFGNLDEALKLFEAARKRDASAAILAGFTQFCVSHSQERKELEQTADKISEEALARFPKEFVAYQNAVRFRLWQGDRAKAGQVLDQALNQNTNDPEFWNRTGHLAEEVWPLADTDKRAEHLQKVNPFFERAEKFAQDSGSEQASLTAADYFLFSNQLPRAAAICENLIKRNGSLDARKRLVRLYEAMERPVDSLRSLEDLVKAYPLDVEHRKLLANQYIQKREYPKALEQLQAALQAGGGGLQDYLQICNLLRVTRQPEKYLQFTERAVQLYPGEPRTLYHEALAQNQNKNYAEGAKLFEETTKLAETRAPELLDDSFHFAHGVSLERGGRYDEAAIQFEKSIELTPTDNLPSAANAMNYLGYMWLERGEHMDKAEELIRKANELEPDNAAYMDSLGWLHFKAGKVEQALGELLRAEKKLKQVDPEDAEILDHIAQAYDKSGQRAKAQEYWKRVVDLKPPDEKLLKRAQRELGPEKPVSPKDDPSLKTR
jgi:tetratricopeptide (TPR) repeat protein